jgi:hypothetical protein
LIPEGTIFNEFPGFEYESTHPWLKLNMQNTHTTRGSWAGREQHKSNKITIANKLKVFKITKVAI